MVSGTPPGVTVTFAGSGDAFGSGGRLQACIHLQPPRPQAPVLLDCGATSLPALRRCGLDPGAIAGVFVSHLHGDHFGGLPFLILDAQFAGRTAPLAVAGPPGTGQRLAEAMECLFPGSSRVRRRFAVEVTELGPGGSATTAGARAQAFQASHPSGAPALILRLTLGGRIIAYTGDTAWTQPPPRSRALAPSRSRAPAPSRVPLLPLASLLLTRVTPRVSPQPPRCHIVAVITASMSHRGG